LNNHASAIPNLKPVELAFRLCRETMGGISRWPARPIDREAPRPLPASASPPSSFWGAHLLQPHRRQFKLSNDPEFVAKLRDVVGLYVNPPAHAVVLSLDEKSQIQALDRTQPGLPIKKGRAGTMTHDYVRNGTTTLFAAMNVLDGTVIGQNMQRHRHREFIRFLNAIERKVPVGKGRPRHSRQLRRSQAPRRAGMAGASSALGVPLRPDVRFLA
jgi:hypothetical protein